MPPSSKKLDLEYCREQLAEDDAVLIEGRDSLSVSLVSDAEIQRGWIELSPDEIPQFIEYLDVYTSAKNLRPSRVVRDPKGNEEVFPGLYRQAYIRRTVQGEVSALVQILRKGYITSLVSGGAVDWSEARLTDTRRCVPGTLDDSAFPPPETGGDVPEEYILVHWDNVSPDDVRKIENQLNAQAIGGWAPKIRGEVYGTDYHRIYTTSKINDDGSATITLMLAQPEFALLAYETFITQKQVGVKYFWGVPKELAQGVLDAERTKGNSATASYVKQGGLVDIVIRDRDFSYYRIYDETIFRNCDRYDTAFYYWGVEDIGEHNIPPDPPAGVTWRKEIRNNGDGSFDVLLVRTTRNYRWYDWRRSTDSSLSEIDTYRQFGITDNAKIIDISMYNIQGLIYRQNITIREDCSKDVVTEADESQEKLATFKSSATRFIEGDSIIYKNQRTRITVPTVTGSGVYRLSQAFNEDGTYDADLFYQRGTDVGEAKYESLSSTLADETSVIYRSRTSPVQAPPDGLAYLYRVTNSLDETGHYDARLQYVRSNDVASMFRSSATLFRVGNSILYSNWHEKVEVPDWHGAGVYRMRQAHNQDGTYDAQLDYIYGTGAGVAYFHSFDSVFEIEDAILYKAYPQVITAPETNFGHYRVNQSLDEDGLYNGFLFYRRSDSAAIHPFLSMGSLLEDENAILYRKSAVPLVINDTDLGMYRVSQSIDEEGTYSGIITYRTGTERIHSHYQLRSTLTDQEVTVYRHRAIPPTTSFSLGEDQELSSRLNELGLYDCQLVKLTSKEIELYHAWFSNNSDIYELLYRNQRSFPQAAVDGLQPQRINRVDPSYNRDGTLDVGISSAAKSDGVWWDGNEDDFYYLNYDAQPSRGEVGFEEVIFWQMRGYAHYVSHHISEELARDQGAKGILARIEGSGVNWRCDTIYKMRIDSNYTNSTTGWKNTTPGPQFPTMTF